MLKAQVAEADYQLVQQRSCNLCGSDDREFLFSCTEGSIPAHSMICRKCGLIYLKETLSEEESEKFYAGDDWHKIVYGRAASERLLGRMYRDQMRRGRMAVEFIEDTIGSIAGKRVLDVGSGTGGYVGAFQEAGAESEGVEPSESMTQFGETQGQRMICDSFRNLRLDSNYDIVSSTRALNHFNDPVEVLQTFRSLLRPGGTMFLEVLNFPHAIRRKALTKCIKIDHPFMFTVQSLRGYLVKCGFEVQALESDLDPKRDFGSLNHMHILGSVTDNALPFEPGPTDYLDTRFECLTNATQFLSNEATNSQRQCGGLRRFLNKALRRVA